jgi:hypothetical protein
MAHVGDLETVKNLIEHGAQVNAQEYIHMNAQMQTDVSPGSTGLNFLQRVPFNSAASKKAILVLPEPGKPLIKVVHFLFSLYIYFEKKSHY